ncbi:hypothetical protein Tco_1034255 [Tanacetum coccineum]
MKLPEPILDDVRGCKTGRAHSQTEIVSPLDVHVHHEVPRLQASPLSTIQSRVIWRVFAGVRLARAMIADPEVYKGGLWCVEGRRQKEELATTYLGRKKANPFIHNPSIRFSQQILVLKKGDEALLLQSFLPNHIVLLRLLLHSELEVKEYLGTKCETWNPIWQLFKHSRALEKLVTACRLITRCAFYRGCVGKCRTVSYGIGDQNQCVCEISSVIGGDAFAVAGEGSWLPKPSLEDTEEAILQKVLQESLTDAYPTQRGPLLCGFVSVRNLILGTSTYLPDWMPGKGGGKRKC